MEGEQPTEAPQDVVSRAEAILAEVKLREQNAISREQKAMEIEARRILGGQSVASQPVEKKEETPQEYKDRIMRGGV